jgi:S1-C subfamily serine protease
MKIFLLTASVVIAISLINPRPSVTAQNGAAVPTVCAAGEAASGDLGYAATECHGCVISGRHAPGEPDMEFDSEPIVSDIRAGGPADGKLEERDVLVALDGKPITTRAAAIQLSWLKPGQPVRVTVRRQEVLTDVEITPAARCRRVTPPRRISFGGRIWQ